MKKAPTVTFIMILLLPCVHAQDSLVKRSGEVYARWSCAAFYDIVRTTGLSVDYKINGAFQFNLGVSAVYPRGILSHALHANDYFFNKGRGATLGFKYRPGLDRKFFVGFNYSFYQYGYSKEWAEMSLNYDKYVARDFPKVLQDRKTSSKAFAMIMGYSLPIKNFFFEYFLALGGEMTDNRVTVYDRSSPLPALYQQPPYSYAARVSQIYIQTGICIGYGFKKVESVPRESIIEDLLDQLKKEESVIDQMLADGKITQDDYWDGYIAFRDAAIKKLRKELRKNKNNIKAMTKAGNAVFTEITSFIEKQFNFRYYR